MMPKSKNNRQTLDEWIDSDSEYAIRSSPWELPLRSRLSGARPIDREYLRLVAHKPEHNESPATPLYELPPEDREGRLASAFAMTVGYSWLNFDPVSSEYELTTDPTLGLPDWPIRDSAGSFTMKPDQLLLKLKDILSNEDSLLGGIGKPPKKARAWREYLKQRLGSLLSQLEHETDPEKCLMIYWSLGRWVERIGTAMYYERNASAGAKNPFVSGKSNRAKHVKIPERDQDAQRLIDRKHDEEPELPFNKLVEWVIAEKSLKVTPRAFQRRLRNPKTGKRGPSCIF